MRQMPQDEKAEQRHHRRQDQRAEWVDMLQRVEADPAELPGGVVAEPVRDKAVRRLMKRDGDDQRHAQRETKTFSNRFARLLMDEMKSTVRMHKHPLKSAGFRVLKAPDVPSVLVEIGYVSNKGDLEHLVSENWRNKAVGSMVQAIDTFFAKRLATAGPAK